MAGNIYVPLYDDGKEKIQVNPSIGELKKRKPWIGRIKQAVETSPSMSAAARLVECDYKTFRKWAKLYGYWLPNQSGKGIPKKRIKIEICPCCMR